MSAPSCWKILTRRKALTIGNENGSDSDKLGRILNTFDLTALGVGATLGVGVYVLAGHVSKDQAGPSVVLSFLIAAVASFLAGLCYAEFGARVPKSGSAYIYSYVCIGEFMAFIIGWNLMLEYIIGSASVSRGLSLYIDTLANDTMKIHFREIAPMEWDFMSRYFDFFGFSVAILLGVALAFGLKKSTMVNNFFTILNIGIVLFVVIAGAINADIANWNINPMNVSSIYNVGEGGFFPFGFEGTLRGAATCFFGFVGFDCIATTGEEVRNPRKAIPRAILFSLCTIFLAYFGVSTVLTLMWPYYLQDVNAPLPFVFNEIGWTFAKWTVAIGGIIGLVASLFGAMFPQPRIIYAMAQDGLVFRALGEISPRHKTPVFGTLCGALLTGTMAGLFDLKALVNMLSIGTLMAYTVVAISILILRFSEEQTDSSIPSTSKQTYESSNLLKPGSRLTGPAFIKQLFNVSCVRIPSHISTSVVGVLVTLYCLVSLALSLTIYYAKQQLYDLEPWAWTLAGTLLGLLLIVLLLMSIQPRETADAPFKVPLVPLLPAISIFVNIYLMLMLDVYTWIRFGIWMGIGLPIYLICVCCGNTNGKSKTNDEVNCRESKISDHIRSEGIENGGFVQSEESTVTPNGFYSQNLKDAVNGTEDKQFNLIATAGTYKENGEKDEDITQTKAKSQTPSPKNSMDEIIAVSELSDLVTEKIEPNGKAYFVEDVNEKDSDRSSVETNKAIALLDDILNDEEKTMDLSIPYPSLDDESLASPVFRERSVVADIHREDEISMQHQVEDIPEQAELMSIDSLDIIETPEPAVNNTPEPVSLQPRAAFVMGQDVSSDFETDDEDEVHYNRLNSQRQKQFMTRLSTLLENPQPKQYKRKGPRAIIVDENSNNLKLQKSSSEPNFVLLLDTSPNNESETDSPNRTPTATVPPAPLFNETVFNSIKPDTELSKDPTTKSTPTVKFVASSPSNSSVPEAPKFDPILYNTVGKHKSPRASLNVPPISASSSGYADVTLRKINPQTPPAIDSKTPEANGGEPPANSREVFRSKLEQILQRGPVNKVRPKTLPPSLLERQPAPASSTNEPTTATSNGNVVSPKDNSSPRNFRELARAFDTAKKQQKLIFDDVLKAINPDTRPSVIRNSLEHRMSFSEFKNGLKKTVPPKPYLPNA
ncbi:cationic amino acid transporter 2-like [Wyeomyia smithii]|uniref:cationic amino acid transporter 2-like n=1 Tax=Wyeomyia smithii TaxID=174621 RepID=UPI002468129A|nr:cationic amino acid transporter 2-like [Wyeomyia smithii]XP_055538372.1 cationic amino acid transporter 2-like [Wyeomyia smithii]